MITVEKLYDVLYARYGTTGWWPADSPDEVIAGTILTQNTSWTNVEKAMQSLKANGPVTLQAICSMPSEQLESAIKSSGFYRQKAARLKGLSCAILSKYGSVEKMAREDQDEASDFLKNIKGVGQETLDSILLYALEKPVFVVDKYTARIFQRTGIMDKPDMRSIKEEVHIFLDKNIEALKNFHGMIVYLGKDYCRTKPLCGDCPVKNLCAYATNGEKHSDE
ncbi:MAG: endonuclease III domain-containing protein [Thermoplasmataceae archaeon]